MIINAQLVKNVIVATVLMSATELTAMEPKSAKEEHVLKLTHVLVSPVFQEANVSMENVLESIQSAILTQNARATNSVLATNV